MFVKAGEDVVKGGVVPELVVGTLVRPKLVLDSKLEAKEEGFGSWLVDSKLERFQLVSLAAGLVI